MARILVTGHNGDVGSELLRLFREAGEDAAPLDLGKDGKADRILHLAAQSPPADPQELIQSNVIYLRQVIEYAVRLHIREVVFFSSVSIYGDPDREDVAEDAPPSPQGVYGLTKWFGEELFRSSPLTVLCLRLPAILGMKNVTNFICRTYVALKEHRAVEVTNPDRVFNNFISIGSLFEFLRRVALKGHFDVVNLASRKEMTLRAIVMLLKESLGSASAVSFPDARHNFFNLSTRRAEEVYGFRSEPAQSSLRDWVVARRTFEGRSGMRTVP